MFYAILLVPYDAMFIINRPLEIYTKERRGRIYSRLIYNMYNDSANDRSASVIWHTLEIESRSQNSHLKLIVIRPRTHENVL